MNEDNKSLPFLTNDLFVASVLATIGYKVEVEKVVGSSVSNFAINDITIEDYSNIQQIVAWYWGQELAKHYEVDPYWLLKNYRTLKSLAYSKKVKNYD